MNIHLLSRPGCDVLLPLTHERTAQVPVADDQPNMQTTTQDNPIIHKTRELCQTILDQADMRSARQRIQTFMADETARAQYNGLMAKGKALQQKQQRSVPLNGEEISDFEKDRDALLNNPVARGFLDAQEELHHVHQSISQFVSKTLELGRVPTEADWDESGSCGSGCECGHSC